MLWNAQSLNNKLNELKQLLCDNDIDICFVTETWLTSQENIVSSSLKELGYNIFHYNRPGQKGGGAAVIIKSKFEVKHSKSLYLDSFECVLIVTNNLTFVVIYRNGREPNATFFEQFYNFLENMFIKYKKLLICGDFNFHVNKLDDCNTIKLNEIFSGFGLKQSVNGPTHKSGNTLDLIIHCENTEVSNIKIENDSSSDHSVIYFKTMHCFRKKIQKKLLFRNFNQVNTDHFKRDISIAVDEFIDVNVDNFADSICALNNCLGNVVNHHAPEIQKYIKATDRPKWMDNEFLDKRRKRRALYKKWKRSKLNSDKEAFMQSRSIVHDLSTQKKRDYCIKSIENCNNSQKELFKVCRNLLGTSKCSPLPIFENRAALANRYNLFFRDKISDIRKKFVVNTIPSKAIIDTPGMVGISTFSTFNPVTLEELKSIIQSNTIKTSIDDPIPASLLGSCLDEVLPALLHVVNLSLTTGSMDGLKNSIVTPLLKKFGLDSEVLSNYRPVTNIAYISKLIERVVLSQLNIHMTQNKLHIPNQSGYKTHHSCETLLTKLVNDILISLDSKSCVVLLLLDLSAAFDTVDHNMLLSILHDELGLSGTVLQWISSFLTGRRQSTSIEGSRSDFVFMPFGVPQGSVLGPVLFNIYVRNLIALVEQLGFSMHGYADDHQVLHSFHRDFQFQMLRYSIPNCINTISDWMQKHFLKLNSTKSQIIVFTPYNLQREVILDYVFLNKSAYISISHEVLNLGIKMDHQLTFSSHISTIISQCYSLIRNIAGIRKYLSVDHIKSLVNSIIVSKLDYCNSILFGISASDLNRLQKLQNSCARLIYSKKKHEHTSHLLRELHWLPIRQRVVFKINCMVHKCLHNSAPIYLSDLLTIKDKTRLFLSVPRTKSPYGDRAFNHSAPSLWNALPSSLRLTSSFTAFKSQLKHHLFSSFTEYISIVNKYKS